MALGKMALGKMAGWVKSRRVKWNWVNCHVTGFRYKSKAVGGGGGVQLIVLGRLLTHINYNEYTKGD